MAVIRKMVKSQKQINASPVFRVRGINRAFFGSCRLLIHEKLKHHQRYNKLEKKDIPCYPLAEQPVMHKAE
jgi:hypothetical protein